MFELISPKVAIGLALIWLVSLKLLTYLRSPLRKIPTIGYDGPLSYLTAVRSIKHSTELIQEGYERYHGRAFKVAAPDRWMVFVSGTELVEEVRRAADDDLSFMEATGEFLQTEWTMGPQVHHDPYHVPVVRGIMTRSLGIVFPEVRDEVMCAMKDLIASNGSEWVKVPAVDTIMKIVCRTSNRLFVGLPLCRDPDYIALNTDFTMSVVLSAQFINLFPKFMKNFVAHFLTNVPREIKRGMRHLEPIITYRIEQQQAYGKDWPGKPVDMLSWIIDEALSHPERETVRELTLRILTLNFAAIHTTTMSFTSALFFLAAHPEFAHPLREEILAVTAEHGWTKDAMDKFTRMDSFLKESQRLMGLGSVSLTRKALRDYTFADGTTVPQGTLVSVPSYAIHSDPALYPHPREFLGLRFDDLRNPENPGKSVKQQMITTSPEYLIFGHGRHACPGRFFAVNELKIILSQILLTYDVKFENEGVFPEPSWFGSALVPDAKAEVMFRERKA